MSLLNSRFTKLVLPALASSTRERKILSKLIVLLLVVSNFLASPKLDSSIISVSLRALLRKFYAISETFTLWKSFGLILILECVLPLKPGFHMVITGR